MHVAGADLGPAVLEQHAGRAVKGGRAHLKGTQSVAQLVPVQRLTHIAPAGGPDGDEAARRTRLEQGEGRGGGVTQARPVGEVGGPQVGPAVQVVDAGLPVDEDRVVQDRT